MNNKKKITIWKLVPDDFELNFQKIYNKVMGDLGPDTDQDDPTGNHFCDNAESYLRDLHGIDFNENPGGLNQDVPDEISDDFLDRLYDGTH